MGFPSEASFFLHPHGIFPGATMRHNRQQAGQAKLGKVSSSQGAFVYRLYLAYYLSRISPGSMALHNWQTARASQVKPGCFCGSARVRLCTDIPVPVHCTSNTPTWHTMIHLDLGKLSSWKGLIRDALA